MSGEGMERITNMIKLVDTNTTKQIGALDRRVKRLALLEADVEDLKANGIGANMDIKSKSGGFSAKQVEEVQECIETVNKHAQRI